MKHLNKLPHPFFAVVIFVFWIQSANAQISVTQVYTDYGGFWTSNTVVNNPVQPDTNHNLLAFTYSGTTYSTGVNDALLTTNSVTFTTLNLASFNVPAGAISSPGTGSTYIGVGLNSTETVVNDIAQYLTDGPNGLNIGTGVFNIPVSKITYPVSGFNIGAIGDGIPDVMLTQIGDPPASANDTLYFADGSGNVVGSIQVGSVGAIPVVGQTKWKFYTPTTPPVQTAVGANFRDLRIVGFDLSDFGLTILNLPSIASFVHKVSGQSDQAFLAHNTASFISGGGVVLPIVLQSFEAVRVNDIARLNWTTSDAKNFSRFEIERSVGNADKFVSIATVAFKDATGTVNYNYDDKSPIAGLNFYRLKMVDRNNTFMYSKTKALQFAGTDAIEMYPNPVNNILKISLPEQVDQLTLISIDGKQIPVSIANVQQQNGIDVSTMQTGIYNLRIVSGANVIVRKFQVIH